MVKTQKQVTVTKVVDDRAIVRCTAGQAILREEVWQDSKGNLVKYNLALINHMLYSGDNGRVLGYDNAHGSHHRHYCGTKTSIRFTDYTKLLKRFLQEVEKLKKDGRL